ncbi:MAG: BlaI/MecI/CopY family transcriptional regulator [Oscillospiraceae bacterium]|nr:BlaI/MecI/CopY family transcriptional regulator [Oscillospiraceae bacterium]
MSIKKLPDAEFEIMKAIWGSEEPVTSPELTEKLRRFLPEKDYKPQTVLTMLTRLEKKGFLRSEKNAKERSYFSLVSEREYIAVEQESFRRRFTGKSFSGLVKALYDAESVSEEELNELRDWIDNI